MDAQRENRRRRRLIKPALQIKATMIFLGMGAFYVLLQTVLFLWTVTGISDRFPDSSDVIHSELVGALYNNLIVTIVVMVPLTVAIGILVTFRVAGPVHRFEMFLRQVINGDKPRACGIRQGDEFQELCDLLNEVTAAQRAPDTAAEESGAAMKSADEMLGEPPPEPMAVVSNEGAENATT